MRKLFLGLALSATWFSGAVFAASWTGTLVDVACKGKDLASHSKKCALSCSKSGYGLVTADGKFVKFDESGNAQALEAIQATAKEKDLKATVTGTLDGDVLKVDSIRISD